MTLSVIGAGLSRTGTMSLTLALEQLGLGKCYHMTTYLQTPEHHAFWDRAAEGDPVDFDEVFRDFGATTDTPGNMFYAALAEQYSNAKVILTVREPNSWFESITSSILTREATTVLSQMPKAGMLKKSYWELFGGREQDRDYMLAAFEQWNDTVRRTIPAGRLLQYEVSEGWEPLCRFLELAVPDFDFPKLNAKEEFQTSDPQTLGPRILRERASAARDGMIARQTKPAT